MAAIALLPEPKQRYDGSFHLFVNDRAAPLPANAGPNKNEFFLLGEQDHPPVVGQPGRGTHGIPCCRCLVGCLGIMQTALQRGLV